MSNFYKDMKEDKKSIQKEIDLLTKRVRNIASDKSSSVEEKESVIDACIAEICRLKDLENCI